MSSTNTNSPNLKCPACSEVFKEPKILPGCKHNVCKECVQGIFLSSLITNLPTLVIPPAKSQISTTDNVLSAGECVGVACPACDKVSVVDARIGVDGLQTNSELKALCEQTRMTPCAECGQRGAEFDCVECEASFCDECFQVVHRPRVMRSHKQLGLGEAREAKDRESLRYCRVHPQQLLTGLCETDQTLVCGVCVVSGDHKGHNCVGLDEANRKLVGSIGEDCARIEQVCASITPCIPLLHSLCKKVSITRSPLSNLVGFSWVRFTLISFHFALLCSLCWSQSIIVIIYILIV